MSCTREREWIQLKVCLRLVMIIYNLIIYSLVFYLLMFRHYFIPNSFLLRERYHFANRGVWFKPTARMHPLPRGSGTGDAESEVGVATASPRTAKFM